MHNNNVQSRVLCDWIGPGAVFHSPEVLGSRGGSCVGPCGCPETPRARDPGAAVGRKGLEPRIRPGYPNKQFCLVPDFSQIGFSFSPFSLMLTTGLLYIAFIMFKYGP